MLIDQHADGITAQLAYMASHLSAPLRNLAYALAQVRDHKAAAEGGAGGPAAAGS